VCACVRVFVRVCGYNSARTRVMVVILRSSEMALEVSSSSSAYTRT